jgi:hypothetical protein
MTPLYSFSKNYRWRDSGDSGRISAALHGQILSPAGRIPAFFQNLGHQNLATIAEFLGRWSASGENGQIPTSFARIWVVRIRFKLPDSGTG